MQKGQRVSTNSPSAGSKLIDVVGRDRRVRETLYGNVKALTKVHNQFMITFDDGRDVVVHAAVLKVCSDPNDGRAPNTPSRKKDVADDDDGLAVDAASEEEEESDDDGVPVEKSALHVNDDPEVANVHAKNHRAAIAAVKAMEGKEVTVAYTGKGTAPKEKSVKWTVKNMTESGETFSCAPPLRYDTTINYTFLATFRPIDLFLRLHRCSPAEAVRKINEAIAAAKIAMRPVTEHEYLLFRGLCLLGTLSDEAGVELWTKGSIGMLRRPDFGQYMSLSRFKEIKRVRVFINTNLQLIATDPWAMIDEGIKKFNFKRAELITHGPELKEDESMSASQPRTSKTGLGRDVGAIRVPHMPHLSYVQRKPKPLGSEFKNVADAQSGCMLFLELQKGKHPMMALPYSQDLGATVAVQLRMVKEMQLNAKKVALAAASAVASPPSPELKLASVRIAALEKQVRELVESQSQPQDDDASQDTESSTQELEHQETIVVDAAPLAAPPAYIEPKLRLSGDGWFGSVPASICLKRDLNVEFIGQVKTCTSGFPKKLLQDSLKMHPSGSWLCATATVAGVDLVATGYKYNRKRVLMFISTKGAGRAIPGAPYVARFPGPGGNVQQRLVPRPALVGEFFEHIDAVDLHNNDRQHRIHLEESWVEGCQWNRLDMTLFGMEVADTRKAMAFALSEGNPMKTWTVKRFVNELAKDLIFNSFDNGTSDYRRKRTYSAAEEAELVRNDVLITIEPTPMAKRFCNKIKGEVQRHKQLWCKASGCSKKTQWRCKKCGVSYCRPGAGGGKVPRYCFANHAVQCAKVPRE